MTNSSKGPGEIILISLHDQAHLLVENASVFTWPYLAHAQGSSVAEDDGL